MIEKKKKYLIDAFNKWVFLLGLEPWKIDIHMMDNIENTNGCYSVFGRVTSDWRYMLADIYINLETLEYMTRKEIERSMLHELIHIVLNEMRDSGKDDGHEERVVTSLTNAFLWTRKYRKAPSG